jgi:tetratricopeptide (TPR) repeat protein
MQMSVNSENAGRAMMRYKIIPICLFVCLLSANVFASREKQLFETGIDHLKQNRYEAAVQMFTELIELDPDNAEAYKNRGVAHMKLGQYDPAILDFEKTRQMTPDLKGVHSNLGVAWYYKGEYQKAIAHYDMEIALSPDSHYVYFNRAISWAELKEYDKSLDDITKTLALVPDYYPAYCLKGDLYLELADMESARAAYENAVKLDPEKAYARNQLEKIGLVPIARAPDKKSADPAYEIQTGAFQVQENARKQLRELRKLGYDARILKVTRPGNVTWHLVRIGTFSELKTAEQSMADFVEKTGMKAYVRSWNRF